MRRIALLCLLIGCGGDTNALRRSLAHSSVSGALCNDATKRFIPDAEVTLLEHDTDGTLLSQRVGKSDEQGKYIFDDVGNGTHEIRAQKGDFAMQIQVQVTAGKNLNLPIPDCELPSGVVTGRICDVNTGDWLTGASVSVATEQGTRVADQPTNSEGEFSVSGISAGPREVVAQKGSVRIVVPVTVSGDASTDLNVTDCVQAGLSNIQGQICANSPGIWLAGAQVSAKDGSTTVSATTDAAGKYRLRGLHAGAYKVTVKKGVYQAEFDAVTVENKTTILGTPVCTSGNIPVAVVSGDFDRVQRVMSQLQFSNVTIYKGYAEHDPAKDLQIGKDGSWSGQLLDGAMPEIFNYKIAMFNGGLDLDDLGTETERAHRIQTLREYVQRGGVIYVSDYAFSLLAGVFGAPIVFSETTGPIQQVKANVVDPLLATKLGSTNIDINFPRAEWRLIENMTSDVKPYLRSNVRTNNGMRSDVPLMVSFPYGQGRGVYTSIPADRQPSMQFNQVIDHIIFDL